MPSWNIHTAHVERLLADHRAGELGIPDENAFLFGNYVPDLYLGFMVPETTYRLDYCMTHMARRHVIPIPDADLFWDTYVRARTFPTPATRALTLGAWAHLVADRFYNGMFRRFMETCDGPKGDELRLRKQADFNLFGNSLGITSHVRPTPELFEAALAFRAYSILPGDVKRAIDVASGIVRACEKVPENAQYQLIDPAWMLGVFNACDERLAVWLASWQHLVARGADESAESVRAEAGLPPKAP